MALGLSILDEIKRKMAAYFGPKGITNIQYLPQSEIQLKNLVAQRAADINAANTINGTGAATSSTNPLSTAFQGLQSGSQVLSLKNQFSGNGANAANKITNAPLTPSGRVDALNNYSSNLQQIKSGLDQSQSNLTAIQSQLSDIIPSQITKTQSQLDQFKELQTLLAQRGVTPPGSIFGGYSNDARIKELHSSLVNEGSLTLDKSIKDISEINLKTVKDGISNSEKKLEMLRTNEKSAVANQTTTKENIAQLQQQKSDFVKNWTSTYGDQSKLSELVNIDRRIADINKQVDALGNYDFANRHNDPLAAQRQSLIKERNDLQSKRDVLAGPKTETPQSFMQKHGDQIKFGGGAATAAGSGFALFGGIQKMVKEGATLGSIAGAGAALGGLAIGLNVMAHTQTVASITSFLNSLPMMGHFLASSWAFIFSPWGMVAIAAAIVTIAIVTALFGNKPTPEEAEMEKFNDLTVWTTGKVLMMTSASAFLSMGYNIDRPMDINSAGIAIPTIQLRQAMSSTLANANGSPYTGDMPYNTPIVIAGGEGEPDKVMIVTKCGVDASGRSKDCVKMITLADNMKFAAPTGDVKAYVPFFVDGKLNNEAVASIETQRALLEAQKKAKNQSPTIAAGAANKNVTVGN